MRLVLPLLIAGLASVALAQEAEPPTPKARSSAGVETTVPLPRERPDAAVATPLVKKALRSRETPDEGGNTAILEPETAPAAPPRIYQTACPAVLLGLVEAETLPPLSEGACGEQSPLAVTGVSANGRMIPFSGEAILNCGMATALPEWAAAVDSYLMARDNTKIETILVGTSYMCRDRNNGAGGDLSEHGFANGLDVVGFKLEDGRTVTVQEGWPGSEAQGSRILRFAHDAACSRFTTTLGPEANALHEDHLHLDLGCHGKSCTARMCE